MRLAAIVFVVVSLMSVLSARGELCPDCRGRSYTKDIGRCTQCEDGRTMSGQFKLCLKCSARLGQCHHCLKPLTTSATTQPVATQPIDQRNDGNYVQGPWEYRFKVTLKGTRSEGSTGELFYSGKPVAEPEAINDFYQTPWGPMYWVAKRPVPWGPHGWALDQWKGNKPGKQLDDPGKSEASAVLLKLWVRVVHVDSQSSPERPPLEDWIVAELKKLNLAGGVGADWQELNRQFLVIEDSRHFGQLKVRLGEAKDPQSLAVDFGGRQSDVQLPRQAGATRLVHVPLKSSVASMDLYLAFKVAPRPADITQPGTYRSGPWEYSLVVTSPGSKSEGMVGKLLYDGKPVETPARGDYYRTPWGDVQWVGDAITQWGEHGWMLRKGSFLKPGKLLPEPGQTGGVDKAQP